MFLLGCSPVEESPENKPVILTSDDLAIIRDALKPEAAKKKTDGTQMYNIGTDRCSLDRIFINSGEPRNAADIVRRAIAKRILSKVANFDKNDPPVQEKAIANLANKIAAAHSAGSTVHSLLTWFQRATLWTDCLWGETGQTSRGPNYAELKMKISDVQAAITEAKATVITPPDGGKRPTPPDGGKRPTPPEPNPLPTSVILPKRVYEKSKIQITVYGQNFPRAIDRLSATDGLFDNIKLKYAPTPNQIVLEATTGEASEGALSGRINFWYANNKSSFSTNTFLIKINKRGTTRKGVCDGKVAPEKVDACNTKCGPIKNSEQREDCIVGFQ
jgi:hypothetical protein